MEKQPQGICELQDRTYGILAPPFPTYQLQGEGEEPSQEGGGCYMLFLHHPWPLPLACIYNPSSEEHETACPPLIYIGLFYGQGDERWGII